VQPGEEFAAAAGSLEAAAVTGVTTEASMAELDAAITGGSSASEGSELPPGAGEGGGVVAAAGSGGRGVSEGIW